MSSIYQKIKYRESGEYGSIIEKILYVHQNNSSDITTFYNENGDFLLSFEDTLGDNIFEKMVEVIKNWKENNNIENVKYDEWDKVIKKKV